MSDICFEMIIIHDFTSFAVMYNKYYWSGSKTFLYNEGGGNIGKFIIQAESGKFGVSSYNIIYTTI